ncbi:class I SAM-dependent methyltransferase [Actinomadura sp. 7K507]|uniref:class I SAM-dependent methyltransferase n=1 Tax=Actinomadura sp. 7K507 TaxID=2530365 RepID=UPI0010453D56|nr:class I SAM-dependent methyltransferase [Actinomadura sp. 7K507]TDC84929.1 methyltransferase domain-containing protein [Actinomadura sp. 7K507]
MRIGVIPESAEERQALEAGMVPTPLFETQLAFTLAQVVMVGAQLGVFDALADERATAAQVAERCGTHPEATGKLLLALAGAGYVQGDGESYELTTLARTWLVRESPHCITDKLLFQFHEWDLMAGSADYVRTGRPAEVHEHMSDQQWGLYQRGMRAMAAAPAQEAAQLIPVPADARTLLDIGGSHGYYSVALCRRHPGLRAVVLDLPEALQHAAPLLAAEKMGDRVTHREGDVLNDDLGTDAYDIVLMVSVAHHFSADENHALAQRAARALRPGGVFVVVEPFRVDPAGDISQFGALTEFYFGLTSSAGTWSHGEIAEWQRQAGLAPAAPTTLANAGFGIQSAAKPVHRTRS